jgi:uncharacterized protein Smg (DUF494 family)
VRERIVDIIVFVMDKFKQQTARNYTDISKGLISDGYTENEINLALYWIFNHFHGQTKNSQEGFSYMPGSSRVLHDVEKMIFTPKAYGYLLQLFHLKIISHSGIEIIVDRALSFGSSRIDVEDVKSLASSILFGMEDTDLTLQNYFVTQSGNTVH